MTYFWQLYLIFHLLCIFFFLHRNLMFWKHDLYVYIKTSFQQFFKMLILTILWPYYYGYFLSMNELQVIHFDPGILFFENIIFGTVSRYILCIFYFWPYLGVGVSAGIWIFTAGDWSCPLQLCVVLVLIMFVHPC